MIDNFPFHTHILGGMSLAVRTVAARSISRDGGTHCSLLGDWQVVAEDVLLSGAPARGWKGEVYLISTGISESLRRRC